ncbi:hypothetical protein RHSP_32211 [Rhizobium freirei PRF 81]|uniref:Uncharacterized protein n=2 Tax=Rhizobium freirei TaxID=1353277 RepID=N6UWR9_9HYPH|nr:hypothetical protein RHSP_32211 [Rhizobium freirei PRF 81]
MIEKVGWAISNVALWSRINDWSSDKADGFPIEICRYGIDGEPEIVVVRRFPRDVGETQALTMVVMEERARAAIEAIREPTALMVAAGLLQSNRDDIDLTENEVAGIFQAMLDAALQEGKETGGLGGILLKPRGGAI